MVQIGPGRGGHAIEVQSRSACVLPGYHDTCCLAAWLFRCIAAWLPGNIGAMMHGCLDVWMPCGLAAWQRMCHDECGRVCAWYITIAWGRPSINCTT
eukprot:361643-Chlamydomonas_euryale.AAC.2